MLSTQAFSLCSYDLDATTPQIKSFWEKIFKDSSSNFTRFTNQNGSKVSYQLTKQDNMHLAMSEAFYLNYINNPSDIIAHGDRSIPLNGIVGFELKLKTPSVLKNKGKILSFPITITGTAENGKTNSIEIFYSNNIDGTGNFNILTFGFSHDGGEVLPTNNLFQSKEKVQIQETNDGYQTIGVYINQSSNQIGFIKNGENYGYSMQMPSKFKNLGFLVPSFYSDIDQSNLNQTVSIEIITDKSKFTSTFPTATKDICGN